MKVNSKYIEIALVIFLLILLSVQAITSMRKKCQTYDETVYIGAGFSYLKNRDFRLNPEHPPLIKMLSALPLSFMNLNPLTDSKPWQSGKQLAYGRIFLYENRVDADTIIFWARIPIVLLSMLLGIYVYKWANELYGTGLFALFLYAFSPNILAHSRLAAIDLGLTCFLFIAVYYFWKAITYPSKRHTFLSGVSLGLALLSKLSALLLIPTYFAVALFSFNDRNIMKREEKITARIRRLSLLLVVIFLIGMIVVWAGYFFEVSPLMTQNDRLYWPTYQEKFQQKVDSFLPQDSSLNKLAWSIGENYPLPCKHYIVGLMKVSYHGSDGAPEGYEHFFMGKISNQAWWYYFPIMFLIKTPIPLLLLLLVVIIFWRKLYRNFLSSEAFLLVPVVIFFAVFMAGNVNLGLRYILPVYPFLFVLASNVLNVNLKRKQVWIKKIGILTLGVWFFLSSVMIYPDYLMYFNEIVGGPDNGYKFSVLSDDWGQDTKRLGEYLQKRKIMHIKYAHYGTADPSYYGISYEGLDCNPTSGIIAIHVTELQRPLWKKPKDCYRWLSKFKPVDKIGYSIFIYNIK